MYLNIENKKKIIQKYQTNIKDKGSTQVQIALLTFKINSLQKHFTIHKKDHHSRRGLLRMISQRKKLLNYFKKIKFKSYNILIESLGLRK
ncbi:30S ribosomal protein S15 [Enterobacteriaceae endosymbiont of Donacia cincticornis]|uniref:30S ribosomal protein S15 n=1 Tax=Enterobacteriaceae endosymbiont of Donacia cincticornis TaxID=2675773 RepID=UPI001448D8C1|nr:30S ribosomal protein S15 [Enterobacteriaceae endosymbiont of Donacia cincticornis]QJC36183.1 30S ribosomal protein S15 [Enterobacteriaceae endosymbiont of Donacia cincticornis]